MRATVRLPVVAALTALAAFGCAPTYVSSYRPADLSRSRVVWDGQGLVVLEGVGRPDCVPPQNRSAIPATAGALPPAERVEVVGPQGRFHVWWVAWPWRPATRGHRRALQQTRLPASGRGGGSGSGAATSGGGNGGGELLLAAALAAVGVVSSGVAIGLALAPPQDDERNAAAIDQMNLQNDRLRRALAACSREPAVAP